MIPAGIFTQLACATFFVAAFPNNVYVVRSILVCAYAFLVAAAAFDFPSWPGVTPRPGTGPQWDCVVWNAAMIPTHLSLMAIQWRATRRSSTSAPSASVKVSKERAADAACDAV